MLREEMRPHLESGLLVTILEIDGLTVYRLADTGYVAFLHEAVHHKSGKHIGFNLKGIEFDMLMHDPSVYMMKCILTEAVSKGEKRAVILLDTFVEKFTELKERVNAMDKNPYINFALEEELIGIAQKALATKKKWRRR